MKLVTAKQVEQAVDCWQLWSTLAVLPTWDDSEWKKDHKEFIIGCVLPVLRLPIKIHRIAVEAYLAEMEQDSDGSTLVPDSQRYGRIKDWEGVMHDYIFWLHRRKMPDAFGHHWSWNEANDAYRVGWSYDGQPARGALWYIGLTAASWTIWVGLCSQASEKRCRRRPS